jgi:hypothetical protein
MFNVRGEGEVVCWKKTMPLLMLRVEGRRERSSTKRKTIFVRKRIPSRFAIRTFSTAFNTRALVPIRWTIVHQTNLLIDQLSYRAKMRAKTILMFHHLLI